MTIKLLLSEEDADLKQYRWHLNGGYLRGRIDGKRIYLHQVIAKRMGIEGTPDHINRDRLDNRRCNMRSASAAENCRNQSGHLEQRKGDYKGITPGRRGNGWRAQITFEGENVPLGTWATAELAAHAYDSAARFLFGEFAACNFIGQKKASPADLRYQARAMRNKYGCPGVAKTTDGRYRAYKVGTSSKYEHIGTFGTLEGAIAAAKEADSGAPASS